MKIMSGNKQVALAVARGQLAWGLTDTDDAIIERNEGHPVEIIYPDSGDGQLGTLFIPNTLAIIKDGPHPKAARRLVDYLLSPKVEARLAKGRSAQIPLGSSSDVQPRVETPRTVKAMPVDFYQAAENWDAVQAFLRATFATD